MKTNTITTAQAVEQLCRALRRDHDYWQTWHANIAMAFIDMARQSNPPFSRKALHLIAQAGAEAFLQQLTYTTESRREQRAKGKP